MTKRSSPLKAERKKNKVLALQDEIRALVRELDDAYAEIARLQQHPAPAPVMEKATPQPVVLTQTAIIVDV
jgi:hypothetical protein